MDVPDEFYDFASEHKGSVKVDLTGAREILAETKRRRLFIQSIEGWRIDDDGYWHSDLSISKMGLSGEDEYLTLGQHYAFDEKLFEHAQSLQYDCIFEVWLGDELSLRTKRQELK